jgi:hypothetical protein
MDHLLPELNAVAAALAQDYATGFLDAFTFAECDAPSAADDVLEMFPEDGAVEPEVHPQANGELSIADKARLTELSQKLDAEDDTPNRRPHGEAEREWLFQATREPGRSTKSILLEFAEKFPDSRIPSEPMVSRIRGQVTYQAVRKAGRQSLLLPREEQELLYCLRKFRHSSLPLRAKRVMRLARGIVAHSRPGALMTQGGVITLSKSWAIDWLHHHSFRVRSATTDRTISPEEVARVGPPFFQELREAQVTNPALCFNMDEFFMRSGDGTADWTWEEADKGKRMNVAIRSDKIGFTASVLTSADGRLHLLQVIHKGGTSQVEVPIQHDRFLQQHRADSHFQNAETFKRWTVRFTDVLRAVRDKEGAPDGKAVLIIDAATQHSFDEVRATLAAHNCSVVKVPEKTTHVFQPADQYVIANFKKGVEEGYGQWIEAVLAAKGAKIGCAEIVATLNSVPKKRRVKVALMVDLLGKKNRYPAVDSGVLASWRKTCILREMFGTAPTASDESTPFDDCVELAAKLEEVAVALGESNDSDPSSDDQEEPAAEAKPEADPAAEAQPEADAPPEPRKVGRPKKLVTKKMMEDARKAAEKEAKRREQPTLMEALSRRRERAEPTGA